MPEAGICEIMMKQVIELPIDQKNVSCPFCQQDILDWSQEQYIQPCEHTAFIALNLGFEYISDRFEEKLPHSVDEIHEQELDVLQEINAVQSSDLILFKQDLGVHNLFRYIGVSETL